MNNRQIPVFMTVLLFISLAAASIYHAVRMVWVFFTPNMKFLGGAVGLFLILCVNIALLICLTAVKLYKPYLCEKKLFKTLKIISYIITVLSAIAALGIIIVNTPETNTVMLMYLKKDLPFIVSFTVILLLLLFYPALEGTVKKLFAAFVAAAVALGFFWTVFPLSPYKIISEPAVMDTGSGYSVVFSTNTGGTGFIEYTYNGVNYKKFDQNDGRIYSDRLIHSISVPYEHLKNNSYTVGSTRVTEDFSYGSRTGKTVKSGPFDFKVNESADQTYLVVSDWHSYLKLAYSAVSYAGDYDAVILLGDPAAGMDFEQEAVKYIVEFAGKLTEGKMPVIYVRGNHETRGNFASLLPDYLGYDKFYYSVNRGPYTFAVLDSGEDKPDDHIEYGGLDDYYTNRCEMVEWLESFEPENDKIITLSHAWQVSEPEEDLYERAWNRLSALGVSTVLGGHTHECRFIDGRDDFEKAHLDKYPGIVIYNDGGHSDSNKNYIASKLTLSEDGYRIEAFDNTGNRVTDKEFNW